MNQKKIVAPKGMLAAAVSAYKFEQENTLIQVEATLYAALLWLTENPIEPTKEQILECLRSSEDPDGRIQYPNYAVKAFVEWQRRMFLAPELNPVVDDIKRRLHGVTLSPKDADEIRQF